MMSDRRRMSEEGKESNMTLSDFCYEHTQVGELVVVRDEGYVVTTAYIDVEDLFSLNPRLSQREVIKDEWGRIDVTTEHGDKVAMPCHYVDLGGEATV